MSLSRKSRAWYAGSSLLMAMVAWQAFVRLGPGGPDSLVVDASVEALLQAWVFWPRLAAGMMVGACLGAAGALMQIITRNPLVSPDLLGITAGAQLGVILGLMLPTALGLPLIFVGGAGAALLTFLAAGGWSTSPLRLTLAGVGIAQCLSAFIALFLSLNDHAAMVVSLWNTGTLQQFGWSALTPAMWLAPLAAALLAVLARPLNLAMLGDAQMRSLGLTPARFKAVTIILSSLLTALAFQLAGPLGFIGLVTPNLLRLAFGVARPSSLVPLCALWGAALTLFADNLGTAIGRWVTVPFGVLSALLGSVAILVLLRITPRAPSAAIARVEGHTVARRLPLPMFVGLMVLLCAVLGMAGVVHGGGASAIEFVQAWWAGEALARVLLDLRLPRLLVDMMAGACFALSGVVLQTVTRNPLAGPEILGVSQTSALAVLLALVLMPELVGAWRFLIAWAGAIAALLLVVGLNLRHGLEPLRLTLTGFALGGAALALIGLLIAQFSTNIAQALIWMVGSSYGRTWADVLGMLPWMVLGIGLCAAAARWMDLLQLGDGIAASLGLAVAQRRAMLVAVASLLVAAPVAVVGPVAFVGLLVPHGVRLLGYYRMRERLWAAPWLGAALLVLADLLGQWLLAPLDIPLGIATAAIGAPCFLLLLARTYVHRGRGAAI
ncbi:iron ABC transporter permease [Pollutimonas bauzanensis]|uniref:Iron complex transport system permease protein n=1 Tax=Pollutimonas bauzanensis TaxID=658167 RepID=A0A1M5S8K5_9BURK|nr:iron ABC transporter permease [Pollutimonas bauzanensis]SHH34819.1 iron complex transport system permease protein [Pollutimonas bauzanensis]